MPKRPSRAEARHELAGTVTGRREWTPLAVMVAVLAVLAVVGGIVLIAGLTIWFS
jgi:hypothetical protein